MFSEELEMLINAALADGEITEKERTILHKRAQAEGVDPDELDMIINGRLAMATQNAGEEAVKKEKKTSTLQQLMDRINEIRNTNFKGSLFKKGSTKQTEAIVGAIRGFSMPNDRDELLELAAFLGPYKKKNMWSSDESEDYDIQMSYKDRYKELETKVKSQFSNDPELMEAIGAGPKKGIFGSLFGK